MYNSKDEILTSSRPQNLSEETFLRDVEEIIDSKYYHSDEISETDIEKAREEIDSNIRPKNKSDTDFHVIHVYDKPWRSRRVRKMVLIF